MNIFQTLELEPRPWLSEESIRSSLHHLALTHHPDRGNTSNSFEAITELSRKILCTSSRLRELLRIHDYPPISEELKITRNLQNIFFSLKQSISETSQWLERKPRDTTSKIKKAVWWTQGAPIRKQLEFLNLHLEQRWEKTREELYHLDRLWQNGDKQFPAIASLATEFAYLEKAQSQLHETLTRIEESK